MNDAARYRAEVITGVYNPAAPEAGAVRCILGDDPAEDFHRYFHWYNILHEVGHAVMDFNCPQRPHPVDEEQWVNDFAVAFWRHYGGEDGLAQVARLVQAGLQRLQVPPGGMDARTFAFRHWGEEVLFTFNNYGWFQFSCVENSLRNPPLSLEAQLRRMGVVAPKVQRGRALPAFEMDEGLPERILAQSVAELRRWGVRLPEDVRLVLSADPNCHMVQTIEID